MDGKEDENGRKREETLTLLQKGFQQAQCEATFSSLTMHHTPPLYLTPEFPVRDTLEERLLGQVSNVK